MSPRPSSPLLSALALVVAAALGFTLGVARARSSPSLSPSPLPSSSSLPPSSSTPSSPSSSTSSLSSSSTSSLSSSTSSRSSASSSSSSLSSSSSSPLSSSSSSSSPPLDLALLKTLEAKPARDRSIDESLALASGHRDLALAEIASLEASLPRELDHPFSPSLARLRDMAHDDALAPRVLAAWAAHPSRAAVDALDDVSRDASASETVRYLADDLLAIPSVRSAASKPLAVALDLRADRDCAAMRSLVGRARDEGDERATLRLSALSSETGCGRDRKSDCYACLRGDTLLFEAKDACAKRSFVAPWSRPRR